MRKRIKHNDLLPWFTDDHRTLPASYVKSCQEFFDSLKQQAPSSKPQASSNKQQAAGVQVTRSNLFTEALKLDTTKTERETKK
jgi:hypothetical protein